MTRGCDTDGLYDIDGVMEQPSGWLARIADAPRVAEPGPRSGHATAVAGPDRGV